MYIYIYTYVDIYTYVYTCVCIRNTKQYRAHVDDTRGHGGELLLPGGLAPPSNLDPQPPTLNPRPHRHDSYMYINIDIYIYDI